MKKFLRKFVSLLLIIFISILIMDKFKILVFSDASRDIITFLTLICVVTSSFSVILTSTSKINKFINSIILISTITGGIVFILNPKLNIFILICLGASLSYALTDMLYKKLS
ncbi:MAG: hypothetical protein ACRC7N_06530 [Clostridium sp.]